VQRIDGYYLYQVGWQVHPLLTLNANNTTYREAFYPFHSAQGALNAFLYQSVFQVSTCKVAGQNVLGQLARLMDNIGVEGGSKEWDSVVLVTEMWNLQDSVRAFEAVVQAEFGLKPLYFVTPKGNMDINGLIEAGHLSFPADLASKAPEALVDAQEATRCIAFELLTAAGFHLHRANEAVLRRYFDQVAGADKRPATRNMGDYLKKMNDLKVGDSKVKAALRDLKDLHRNPLMHPDQHVASVDDAISLLGGVRQAMTHMLKALPTVADSVAQAVSAMAEQAFGPAHP
jgi:hypothetical protein